MNKHFIAHSGHFEQETQPQNPAPPSPSPQSNSTPQTVIEDTSVPPITTVPSSPTGTLAPGLGESILILLVANPLLLSALKRRIHQS
ncbi:hypothetical protein IQ249_12490 [Lusitaniella coriacea LEGE 07157]|uniref:Uncharacterized protein n=1 Tax=Lusitaniella coriacea LEGE 07157 TaxID=945747 RepID=A0A8J7J324_9CYAN|nr:hypothetical protein [Lusitaniella coriacea]MBE9116719.1 hypothetical protein [Lusitaniella coriacea LEGE 07157]